VTERLLPRRKTGSTTREALEAATVIKKSNSIPPLKLHKATGQGYVLLDGARHYVERYELPETKVKYDRMIAEYLANGRRVRVESTDLTVVELVDRFKTHVDGYYVDAEGEPSKEAKHFATIFKPLKELYGRSPACEF